MGRKAKQLNLPLGRSPPPKFASLEVPIPFDVDPVIGKFDLVTGMDEQLKKLELLKEYYGVTEWAALAYALAADFVPGFKTACGELRRKVDRRK